VYLNGKPHCPTCAGREVPAVVGRGISTAFRIPFKVVER
jgi:hypothetical protein